MAQYIPHAGSWLHQERWEDELDLSEQIPEKAVAWWATEQGVMAKGRELGVNPRAGESLVDYKQRVVEGARRAA